MITSLQHINLGPIQMARSKVNEEMSLYLNETADAEKWLNDIDSVVEDLRLNVLSRRCHISIPEIEDMALHLSRINLRLRNFQSKWPSLPFTSSITMDINITKKRSYIPDNSYLFKRNV